MIPGAGHPKAGAPKRLSDLTTAIRDEIRNVEIAMETQKRVIKQAVDNALIIEAAEQELKALHARLATLKGNLRKQRLLEKSGE